MVEYLSCILLLIIAILLTIDVSQGDKIMATVEEVTNRFNERLALLSTQIASVEALVEQLFAQLGGDQAAQLDALKQQIDAGFDSLGSAVEQVGIDDPNT